MSLCQQVASNCSHGAQHTTSPHLNNPPIGSHHVPLSLINGFAHVLCLIVGQCSLVLTHLTAARQQQHDISMRVTDNSDTTACSPCCCRVAAPQPHTAGVSAAAAVKASSLLHCTPHTYRHTFSAIALSTTARCLPVLRAQLPVLCAATAAATAASTSSTVPAGMRPITPVHSNTHVRTKGVSSRSCLAERRTR